MWTPLVIFLLLALLIVAAIEWRERKRARQQQTRQGKPAASAAPQRPEGCCGEHLVCERETLLSSKPEIVYYDDYELDALAGKNPDEFDETETAMFSDVFYSLREDDVAGWCRSLYLRNIALPASLRDEALLIVRERRAAAPSSPQAAVTNG